MAPEMLQKKGHDFSVDYYCLGAILYELLIGSPPFYTTHTSEMFERILTEEISFPEDLDLSNEIIDLITNLLIKDPKYRRGSMGGVKEILAHPWCKKMNLKDIEAKIIETPVKPNVFEFYVDEVSDDGDLAKKMADIYDEAFDDLSEDDENEQIFKNFYFEREKPDGSLTQKLEKNVTKQKHFLSIPDLNVFSKKTTSPNHQPEELQRNMQEIKENILKTHGKHKWSEIVTDSANRVKTEPYFIADQYRSKKANDPLSNVYASFNKPPNFQKSLEYQLSTSQKVEI